VVSFTTQLLYPQGQKHLVPISQEVGWAKEVISTTKGKKILDPIRTHTLTSSVVQPIARCFINYTVPAANVGTTIMAFRKVN
jgi:hypothetical protein